MMRLIMFVPWPVSPAFWPGQVKSHSPIQKSNCFCCAAVQGFWGAEDCATSVQAAHRKSKRVVTIFVIAVCSRQQSDYAGRERLSRGGSSRFLVHLAA